MRREATPGLVSDYVARSILEAMRSRVDAAVDSVAARLDPSAAVDPIDAALIRQTVACSISLGLEPGEPDLSWARARGKHRASEGSATDDDLEAVASACHAIAAELLEAAVAETASSRAMSQLSALSFESQTALSQAIVESFAAFRNQGELATEEIKADIGRSLLDGRYPRTSRWLERARGLGADPNGPYAVVCARPAGGDHRLDVDRLAAVVQRAMRRLPTFSSCLDVDGEVVAIVSLEGATLELVRSVLDEANPGAGFEAGISQELASAALLACGLEQAHIALGDGSTGGSALRSFDDQPVVDVCCLNVLRAGSTPLPAWLDDLNATLPRGEAPLARTLETWLDNDLNLTATATGLIVHPNTVSYRLQQVEEITGLDTKRFDDVVELALALRLHALTAGGLA